MKAWYSKVRDTELKDGSVRADYVVTFETDNFELKRKVEKYLQGIMDRAEQTENSSEKPNNCEPQTNADQHVQRVEYVENDEKSRCWTCKHFESMHETPTSSDGSYYTYVVCTAKECHYEPKDEPQTDCAWMKGE